MRRPGKRWGAIVSGLFIASLALPCHALELEPRQWSHLPLGTSIFGIGYADTQSDIFVDPVLELEDVEMDRQTWLARYIRAFEVFGKSARIDLTQGYIEAEWDGLLEGGPASTSRSGWSDTFVRFAVNLYGAPPLRGPEFAAYRARTETQTIVGVGLAVRLATGEYMEDKLLNLGQNRQVFRPQLGVVHRRGKLTAELTGEVAFYTDNDEFFNDNEL